MLDTGRFAVWVFPGIQFFTMSQDKKDLWMRAGVIFSGVLCISVLVSAIIFCGQVLQMPARMDKAEAHQAAQDVREERMLRDLQIIADKVGVPLPSDWSDLSEGYNPYPEKSENVVAAKPTTQNQ